MAPRNLAGNNSEKNSAKNNEEVTSRPPGEPAAGAAQAGVTSQGSEQVIGGHYKIERQLAAGGFGQTFVAKDLHLPGQPLCVIKQLKTQFSNPALLKTAQRLFDQEAKTLYALGEHAQIPRLLAHFEENQEFYLAQELIDGQPLSELLVLGERWPETKAIALMQDILQVLSFVHAQGVIHRDIKPANLLWRDTDGRIVLIDFGAVKAVQQAATVAATMPSTPDQAQSAGLTPSVTSTIAIGTPGYMPIEQQSGKPRFSSDVYAVGMVGIQALTGLSPTQLTHNEDTAEIEWRSHAPQVSSALADLIDTMMRYDFRSRFTDAKTALNALQALPSQTLAAVTTVAYLANSTPANPTPESQTALQKEETTLKRDRAHNASANNALSPSNWRLFLQQKVLNNTLNKALAATLIVGMGTTTALLWQTRAPELTESNATDKSQKTSQADLANSAVVDNPSATEATATATAPQAAIDLANKADQHFADQDYAQAITLYKQATQLGLDTTETQWNHCNRLADQGTTDIALEVCGLVAGANHNDPDDIIIAGAHLAQAGEHARALTVLTQVERVRPDNLSIPWPKAIALNGLGRYENALATSEAGLAQAQGLDIPNLEALLLVEKGNALIGLNQPEEALSLATEALILFPELPMALELTEKAQLAMQ